MIHDILDVQVGGFHYKGFNYQPIVLISAVQMNFVQGEILKYVTRFSRKDGHEDLKKALHYARLGEWINPANHVIVDGAVRHEVSGYILMNRLGEDREGTNWEGFLISLCRQEWREIIEFIKKLEGMYYADEDRSDY